MTFVTDEKAEELPSQKPVLEPKKAATKEVK